MAYETQPGTIPHRVFAHLKTLDAGTEVSAPELAEVLGVDISSIVPSLTTACKHGALLRRKKEARHSARKVWWYAMGDGTPESPNADAEPEVLPQRILHTFAAPSRPDATRHDPKPAAAPSRGFDAWLSASGALCLQGLQLDDEGDAMLLPTHVVALRKLLGAPA